MSENIPTNAFSEGKSIAVLAYITFIGLIVAFVQNTEKKNTFAYFHIRQSLGLLCTGMALGMINIVPFIGWLVCMTGICALFVLWVIGLLNAVNGKQTPVPVVGHLYNQWFSGIH